MSGKRVFTFEVEQGRLFDMVAASGDGGAALGMRLVGVLLGDTSIITAFGLGAYGVCEMPSGPSTLPNTQEGRDL